MKTRAPIRRPLTTTELIIKVAEAETPRQIAAALGALADHGCTQGMIDVWLSDRATGMTRAIGMVLETWEVDGREQEHEEALAALRAIVAALPGRGA